MYNVNPLLLLDYYKTTHNEQYPEGITKIVSYYTPRSTRIPEDWGIPFAAVQGYIGEYLIEAFKYGFFEMPKEMIMKQYKRILNNTLGKNIVNYDKIESLYDLGYLPLEIGCVPEGTMVPFGVPMLYITNTHPDFAWLVNTLETQISCSLWHPMLSTMVGYKYRQIVNKFYDISVDDNIPRCRGLSDFSMRGQESVESAIRSSAGFCLSFLSTATVPTAEYFERYYNADVESEDVIYGAISTEHSVMNSNFGVDGDEITMIRKLLTEIYPNNNFSMVSDSYDYWNLVDNLLPQLRVEIENHNGFIGIRGDSGDPVEIVTKTIFKLWDLFGGSINSKGYKVLNCKIKAIYGDSITFTRLKNIYQILIDNGFACNNFLPGSGSFSMQCMEYIQNVGTEENPKYIDAYAPYTRDTYGVAIKATYCEVTDSDSEYVKRISIFKAPKTDKADFSKKSQKGCCVVQWSEADKDGNQILYYEDEVSWEDASNNPNNILKPIFKDGKIIEKNWQTLSQIRNRLHDGKF